MGEPWAGAAWWLVCPEPAQKCRAPICYSFAYWPLCLRTEKYAMGFGWGGCLRGAGTTNYLVRAVMNS